MAASNNTRDVSLIIKARDEATKTFDTVAGALQRLVESQSTLNSGSAATQGRLGDLTKVLLDLDKAAGATSSKFDAAAAAVENMQRRAAENTARLGDLKREAESLARVVGILSSESDKAFVGPRRNGLSDALKGARADLRTLTNEITSVGASINRDLAGTSGSNSSLQQLAATERAIAEAAGTARTAIERETKALADLDAAAAAHRAFEERVKQGAAAMLAEADAATRAAAARQAEIEKLKAQEAATASLSREQEAQRRANAFLTGQSGTGNGRQTYAEVPSAGRSARDSAQTFAEEEAKSLKAAADAHRAFEDRVKQGVVALRDEEAAVKRLRVELDPLAEITRREAAELAKLDDWLRRGTITATEHAQAQKMVKDAAKAASEQMRQSNSNAPRMSLFGLRPYETQNLLYQVNDIVTQLGSGTSLSQTLAQQGGQIFQLFQNRIGPAIAAAFSNPYFLGAGAVLGAFVVGLNRAIDNLQRLREINAQLMANADGGDYGAAQLLAASKAMREFGVDADEAVKIVRIALQRGIGQDEILAFSKAAKGLAVVLGTDTVAAADRLSTALTGGYQGIVDLNRVTNVFTAAQMETIRGLFEQGRATDAVSMATDILTGKLGEVADAAESDATSSVRKLTVAWNELVDSLADSKVFDLAVNGLANIARAAAAAARAISGVESLQDKKDKLQGILDTGVGGFAGIGSTTLRQRSVATAKGLEAAPGYENDSVTIAQLKQANALLNEMAAEQAKIDGLQQTSAQQTKDQASERTNAANIEVTAATDALDVNKKITTQAQLQTALAAERRRLNVEAANRYPAADDSTRGDYVNAQMVTRRVALEKQLADYKKQQADAARAAAAADEQALKSYVARVVKAENSTGNPGAKNPNSSATGDGQFVTKTWLALFRKYFPERAETMGRDAILALRKDAETSKTMIELYARENAAALQKSGQAVTEANLHLAHFLGASDAAKVLGAASGTPLKGLISARSIAANPTILGGSKTVDDVRKYADRRAGGNGKGGVGSTVQTELELENRLAEIEQQRLDAQSKFSEKLDDENEKRRAGIDALTAQQGLTGVALINEQKRQAVAEALLQKQQELDRLNADRSTKGLAPLEMTAEQRAEIEKTTAAYFDLAHAKDVAAAKRAVVDDPVRDLTAQRDALQQQMKFLSDQGNIGASNALGPQLAAVNVHLDEAITKARAFYTELAGNPTAMAALGLTKEGVDNIALSLQNSQIEAKSLGYYMGLSLDTIAQQATGGVVSAFDRFAQAVASGGNAFKALRNAFLQFAADFLRQIAQMILQQVVFNLVSGLIKSVTGGLSSSGISAASSSVGSTVGANASIFHEGGIAGSPNRTRAVNPAWFANAIRLHSGGIPGLASNEVPTILEDDEEVLKRSDPRHILNGGMNGGGGGAAPVIKVEPKIINTIDPGEVMSQAANTRVGQQAFINMVSENRDAFNQALGSGRTS